MKKTKKISKTQINIKEDKLNEFHKKSNWVDNKRTNHGCTHKLDMWNCDIQCAHSIVLNTNPHKM